MVQMLMALHPNVAPPGNLVQAIHIGAYALTRGLCAVMLLRKAR
jgi:hypothetical protein